MQHCACEQGSQVEEGLDFLGGGVWPPIMVPGTIPLNPVTVCSAIIRDDVEEGSPVTVREAAIALVAVTWWTVVRMRTALGMLVLWWAAVGLGLVEGSRGLLLIPKPLAWGLVGASGAVWLWGSMAVWRAHISRQHPITDHD